MCLCDKSRNPIIQYIITSHRPLKYINNTYPIPTRQLITKFITCIVVDIYILNVLIIYNTR